jgi:hypothetical protein
LVIPGRKTALVRALHGRATMAGIGAPWEAMGELTREGREGEGEGGTTGGAREAGAPQRGASGWLRAASVLLLCVIYAVHEVKEGKKREKKKRKNGKILKRGNFREKNKR